MNIGAIAIEIMTWVVPVLGVGVNLKSAFSKGLGVVMMLAFIFGLIKIISGAVAISNGNPEGKSAILGGIMVAGAPAVMYVLFKSFGLGGGTLMPSFSF